MLPPLNINKWVEEHKHLLEPPVNAKLIYDDPDSTFVIMIVGGPNQRTDYHINQTDEFFYQFKGDMILKIVDKSDGQFKDVRIREGECFLLPGNTPHSPQRFKDTVGLVIEQKRNAQSIDRLCWFCQGCKEKLFEESFNVKGLDLGKELKPIILRFYEEEPLRTCKKCGCISEKPVIKDNIE
ncbi:3-hydroxyanthranilate 3,4-dioxygenase [Heterostelium album PN500]|uniref:3-hydroxyanthranilate 3,4-dioxygenase n=1 Tax=Heterostelium pallidum (strain ATCC 26659 / Pp 5 / PN500) TaxID=670386 RepID=D3B432_HETP5|nr:3-hydroxyanthranilate 3,4-dioxygenase [Heterostelium album PN500]EFA84080.1 3-hydroxyanthranilate 3,4-dioxygenase [Heterostelium album PN500]|eukprot:XP_020436197.1 3-hydroxyanthranilate 3,4-dioxygenase [Heterostelium album PN500]